MRFGLTCVFLLLLAPACADDPQKPADPMAPTTPALNTTEAPAPPSMAGATVCLSYARDRELVRAKLKGSPTDAKLLERMKSLEALILDAC